MGTISSDPAQLNYKPSQEQKRIEKEVIDMLENTGQDDTRRTFSMEELKPAIKKLKNIKWQTNTGW